MPGDCSGQPQQLLSVKEVHEQLCGKISLSTLYNMVRRGKLAGVRVEGRVLVEQASLHEYLRRGRVEVLQSPRKAKQKKLPTRFKHFQL